MARHRSHYTKLHTNERLQANSLMHAPGRRWNNHDRDEMPAAALIPVTVNLYSRCYSFHYYYYRYNAEQTKRLKRAEYVIVEND